jgi:hypothetical protein
MHKNKPMDIKHLNVGYSMLKSSSGSNRVWKVLIAVLFHLSKRVILRRYERKYLEGEWA